MRCRNCGYELQYGTQQCPRCHVPVQSAGPKMPNYYNNQSRRDPYESSQVQNQSAGRAENVNISPALRPGYRYNPEDFTQTEILAENKVRYNEHSGGGKAAAAQKTSVSSQEIKLPSRAKYGFYLICAAMIVCFFSYFLPFYKTGETSAIGLMSEPDQIGMVLKVYLFLMLAAGICALVGVSVQFRSQKTFKLMALPSYMVFAAAIWLIALLCADPEYQDLIRPAAILIFSSGIIAAAGASMVSMAQVKR